MKLSNANFIRARNYLFSHGRELEQRLFEYHFENGSPVAVKSTLKKHQNEDGGFQNMAEGDKDSSSPIDTSIALRDLVKINASPKEEMVKEAINYIVQSYDYDNKYWKPDSKRIYKGKELVDWWGNPGAELVGYLHKYSELVPKEFLDIVTNQAEANIQEIKYPLEPFAMLCYLRMAELTYESLKKRIIQKLRNGVHQAIEKDANNWSSWCIKPYWFAMSPDGPLADIIKDDVIRNLEYEIVVQQEDGCFPLHWYTPGEDEKSWKSVITFDVLKTLYSYQMIEGI